MTSNTGNIGSSSDPFVRAPLKAHEFDSTIPEVTAVSSSDIQINDVLSDSGHVVVQQFLSNARKGEYQADISRPILLAPDMDRESGPTPFEPSWQKEANKYFQNLVKEILAKKNSNTSQNSSGGSQVVTPEMMNQIQTILQAVIEGKTATLNKEDQKTVTEAREKTQAAWSLPKTWTFGTQEAINWTPIKANVVPPVSLAESRNEVLIENTDHFTASIEVAADKILKDTPAEDPNRIAITELIKVIAQVISELKAVLQDMQMRESKITTKISEAKFDKIQENKKLVLDALEKQRKMERKIARQKKIARIMKIVAPIISALVFVAAAVGAVFTGGATLIAAAVVSGMLLSYTVVDSEMGLTQKAIDAINQGLEQAFPDKATRDLVKGTILALLAIVMALAIVGTGGGAAASVGSSFATQVAQEVATQLTIQLSMMFIMSSNFLSDIIVDSCIATGTVKKDDEYAQMIIQMVVMAITMIFCMEAMAKGAGPIASSASAGATATVNVVNQAIQNIKTAMINMVNMSAADLQAAVLKSIQMIKEMIQSLIKLMKDLGSAADKSIKQACQAVVDAAKACMNTLKEALEKFTKEPLEVIKNQIAAAIKLFLDSLHAILEPIINTSKLALIALKNTAQSTYDAIKHISDTTLWEKVSYGTGKFLENFQDMSELAKKFETFFKLSGLGVEAGMSIYIGTLSVQLSQMLRDLGEIEKEQQVTQLLLKLLEQLLSSYQTDITDKGGWINNLDRTMANAYSSMSQMSTKITQQYSA